MKNSVKLLILTLFSALLFLGCTDKKKEEEQIQQQVERIEAIEDKIQDTETALENIKEEAESALKELDSL